MPYIVTVIPRIYDKVLLEHQSLVTSGAVPSFLMDAGSISGLKGTVWTPQPLAIGLLGEPTSRFMPLLILFFSVQTPINQSCAPIVCIFSNYQVAEAGVFYCWFSDGELTIMSLEPGEGERLQSLFHPCLESYWLQISTSSSLTGSRAS
ncbi:hypothetical protein H112_05161 [Trichophyton rubrum D6]|uniref:Uncharacterized protein n=3 Tax=Trichophyton TaxID=5550 RepID=A0A080WHZ2_TRIRC|nr:uncharacterized protein TERG_11918 [Trichophyton rubrum CBS 118892]EZF22004.1 hypothetical protein H100_05183 [Trichophyton rubrum MR850]EZF40886.1 hypothetical protein H102_05170 [Trichophyton rubrum CBS 100081]EZF51680.1 hypothetical protein H103_05171 [Trichophyton rubrum CBS 288.86]EZF62215.1 hypothetical protein H104_05164 [Trichophyton rubrum CBS 289.86]EZF72926.1 hypothetical protein H105_05191 [Trichophyton soudanense CBS 452.61]EZF83336.1 hypothetical protein H110_05170 [Trichophy